MPSEYRVGAVFAFLFGGRIVPPMRMEEGQWYRGLPEKIFSVFAGALFGIWFLIYKSIYGICWLLRRIAIDIAKNVYVRLIAMAGGLIVAWMLAQSFGGIG